MNFLKNVIKCIFNKKHRKYFLGYHKALMYWFWKNNYPKAIEEFNSLLCNGISVKSESQIHCSIGEVYYWSGNVEEAEKSLRKSLD